MSERTEPQFCERCDNPTSLCICGAPELVCASCQKLVNKCECTRGLGLDKVLEADRQPASAKPDAPGQQQEPEGLLTYEEQAHHSPQDEIKHLAGQIEELQKENATEFQRGVEAEREANAKRLDELEAKWRNAHKERMCNPPRGNYETGRDAQLSEVIADLKQLAAAIRSGKEK
jgi:TolA-binding protein